MYYKNWLLPAVGVFVCLFVCFFFSVFLDTRKSWHVKDTRLIKSERITG